MKTQTLRIALSAALFAGATLAGLAQAASLTTLEPCRCARPPTDRPTDAGAQQRHPHPDRRAGASVG